MAQYLPFAGRNAIAEMSFGIQLATPFDQKVGESLERLRRSFTTDEFPKLDPVQVFNISFANIGSPQLPVSGAAPASAVSGFNLTKLKADGSISQAIRAINNILSVHFTEYTSWAEIKPRAIGYVRRCLDTLAIFDRNQVTGVLLRYVDRFTFDGAPENASAGLLFRPDNKFVALRVLDRGYQWQSNSGWVEPLVGPVSAFNQLNVISGLFEAAVGIVVDHNSVCNFPAPYKSLAEMIGGKDSRLSLEAVLDLQHKANANLLRNLLNEKMLDTIGLKG